MVVKCSSCHEIHKKCVEMCRSIEYPLSGSRGSANFVWKCQFCQVASHTIHKEKPQHGEWNCKGAESGTKFKKIEFDDGEWHDYDEKSGLPVSVTNIRTEIVRAK
ncbi:hypothetical protein PSHT_06382 [Puccinia striiformis]|uniref:Uncharacterized protein n=1 Tax=Puccinia striiformis TaxID=27350 RepID=A0A2S4W6Q5_9BASI|nr:hypothetical protein PSHT_06382 [Puccinia striiformis]